MSPPCGSSRNDTDNDANHALSSERSKRGAMLKSQSTKRRLAVSAESDAPKGAQEYKPRDGECEVWISQPGKSDQEMVKRYTAGDSFGELALLYNAPRAATVKAVTRSVLWGMDRTTFRAILMHTTNEKRQLYENFLQEVPLLKTLNKYERSAIADVLQGQYFEKGQDIIVEGQCGDKLYFLEEGEADAKAGQKLTMKYRRGDYFGELALLHDQPRAATVTAVTQCKCVTIDRESFKRLLGKLEDILVRKEEMYAAGQSVESN